MQAHEHKDVNARNLLWLGAGLCAMILLAALSMKLLFGYYSTHQPSAQPASLLEAGPELPPQPRLQIHEHVDLGKKLAADQSVLNNYGWVDRNAGVVRIPIDRAIDLLAQCGLPARVQTAEKGPLKK
jgi:hypothetical protein